MITVVAQVAGIAVFFLVTLALGVALRRDPSPASAQRLSRISHAFFWGGLMVPEYAGLVWPGLTHFDEVLGLPPLPFPLARWLLGVPLVLVGGYFAVASIRALKKLGSGSMAFALTERVVEGDVFQRVRNPMSLGLYLQFTGVSLLAGSTWLLACVVLLYIPAHAFNLKFFEERELSARHGAAYDAYRARVPFLVPRLTAGR